MRTINLRVYDEDCTVENSVLNCLAGKTVSKVNFVDRFDGGITLTFTDGSELRVNEQMQAGQLNICASVKGV
jgi:hypothetical protein